MTQNSIKWLLLLAFVSLVLEIYIAVKKHPYEWRSVNDVWKMEDGRYLFCHPPYPHYELNLLTGKAQYHVWQNTGLNHAIYNWHDKDTAAMFIWEQQLVPHVMKIDTTYPWQAEGYGVWDFGMYESLERVKLRKGVYDTIPKTAMKPYEFSVEWAGEVEPIFAGEYLFAYESLRNMSTTFPAIINGDTICVTMHTRFNNKRKYIHFPKQKP